MKILNIIGLSLCLSSCAQWFPASVVEGDAGEYVITAVGNSFAGNEALKLKTEKKATAVCEGEAFDRFKPDSYESHKQETYINGTTQTGYYFSYTIFITCVENMNDSVEEV